MGLKRLDHGSEESLPSAKSHGRWPSLERSQIRGRDTDTGTATAASSRWRKSRHPHGIVGWLVLMLCRSLVRIKRDRADLACRHCLAVNWHDLWGINWMASRTSHWNPASGVNGGH